MYEVGRGINAVQRRTQRGRGETVALHDRRRARDPRQEIVRPTGEAPHSPSSALERVKDTTSDVARRPRYENDSITACHATSLQARRRVLIESASHSAPHMVAQHQFLQLGVEVALSEQSELTVSLERMRHEGQLVRGVETDKVANSPASGEQ